MYALDLFGTKKRRNCSPNDHLLPSRGIKEAALPDRAALFYENAANRLRVHLKSRTHLREVVALLDVVAVHLLSQTGLRLVQGPLRVHVTPVLCRDHLAAPR